MNLSRNGRSKVLVDLFEDDASTFVGDVREYDRACRGVTPLVEAHHVHPFLLKRLECSIRKYSADEAMEKALRFSNDERLLLDTDPIALDGELGILAIRGLDGLLPYCKFLFMSGHVCNRNRGTVGNDGSRRIVNAHAKVVELFDWWSMTDVNVEFARHVVKPRLEDPKKCSFGNRQRNDGSARGSCRRIRSLGFEAVEIVIGEIDEVSQPAVYSSIL